MKAVLDKSRNLSKDSPGVVAKFSENGILVQPGRAKDGGRKCHAREGPLEFDLRIGCSKEGQLAILVWKKNQE